MDVRDFFIIFDTLCIIGFLIGYSFSIFMSERKKRNAEIEEFRKYKEKLNNLPELKNINKTIDKQIIEDKDLCKCGHSLKEHILNEKKKRPCYHVLANVSEDSDLYCECKNYKN